MNNEPVGLLQHPWRDDSTNQFVQMFKLMVNVEELTWDQVGENADNDNDVTSGSSFNHVCFLFSDQDKQKLTMPGKKTVAAPRTDELVPTGSENKFPITKCKSYAANMITVSLS